jgi:hypothetical protein
MVMLQSFEILSEKFNLTGICAKIMQRNVSLNSIIIMIFEVITMVIMKISVFWDIMQYSMMDIYQHFFKMFINVYQTTANSSFSVNSYFWGLITK